MDENGIIRLRGRISKQITPEFEVNPIILDPQHQYTLLLLKQYHDQCGHQGVETVANEVRQKYWVINRTTAIKKAVRGCQR